MPRSLRGRLIAILALLAAAAVTSGFVMLALCRQSASARLGEASALAGQACDAIGRAYRFYTAGWHGGQPGFDDPGLRRDLGAVAFAALRDKPGIEGGLWQADAGALAYAFPTYEGSGPKTDVPSAELPSIRAVNQSALGEDRPTSTQTVSGSQTLIVTACPLGGPFQGLTGWTMTRVHSFAGETYWPLMAGLATLLAAVAAAAALASALVLTWSRHVGRIETALAAAQGGELPPLPATGERELDRIVLSLNEASVRLAASRVRAEALTRQVAASERFAALGRVVGGVAHEIRNPIGAMRLKAETALKGDVARKDQALRAVIAQVDRLEELVRRLLNASEREAPRLERIALLPFLSACAEEHVDLAAARGSSLDVSSEAAAAVFDPRLMSRAVGNLVRNAVQAGAPGTTIRITAYRHRDGLEIAVTDTGEGPPEALRDRLFEPFATGRPEGTGLGLSIVREIAEAHGGAARFSRSGGLTTFAIEVPWRES